MHCFLCCGATHSIALCARQPAGINCGDVFQKCATCCATLGGWVGLGSAAAAACSCLTSSSFRALFAETRTKETPSAPTNRLEFIAGVSSKSAQRRLGGCAPEAPPRQRAAASQSWTPAIVARRRGRRRRAMRLPTGRNSPDVCP